MTAEYVGLKKNMTVEQAFDYIRKYGVDKETIYTCYVMDEKRRLEGVVTVKDLLMNDYAALMGDIHGSACDQGVYDGRPGKGCGDVQ